MSAKELDSYPFECIWIKGIANANYKNRRATIEALIGLQVSDCKSKAEKEVSAPITKAIVVIPHHYMKEHKQKFKNVSVSVGLESVQVMSEITCAAIGYCHENNGGGQIIIVALNGMTYDAAAITLKPKSVEYGMCVNRKLEELLTRSESQCVNQDTYNRAASHMTKDINSLWPATNPGGNFIILGSSPEKNFIINQFYKSRPNITVKIDNSGHLVGKGAAIYAKFAIEGNEEFRYNISEIFL